MDEIKHYLFEAYSEESLTLLLFYIRNMNPMETMYFLNTLVKIVDRKSSVILLAYLFNAQKRSISYPRYAQKALNYHIHALNKKVSKNVPKMLHRFVSGMRLFSFTETEIVRNQIDSSKVSFNPLNFLIDSIFESLVKTSNMEIENGVKTYFHEGSDNESSISAIDVALRLLCKIKEPEAINSSIVKIVKILKVEDVSVVLSFLLEHEEYGKSFFLYLYLLNRKVYESVLSLILEDRRYFRLEVIKNLVEFDVEKILERITNESALILNYIFRERSVYIKDTARLIEDGKVNISRENILKAFNENYDNVKQYSSCFGLDMQELLEMSRSNDSVLHLTLETLSTQEDLNRFVDLLKEKDDMVVVDIIESTTDSEKKNNLISTILRRKVIRGDLRKHLLARYLENSKFIYGLLPYLEKTDVYRYVADYIVDEESLNAFLKVIECSEVLIFAHKISDVTKATRILDLCFESTRFSESDFLFALSTLEKELPVLLVRTLTRTYMKFPNLKNFVISFLSRLVKKDVWRQEVLFHDMVRCLEVIGPAAIDIIVYLDEGVMYKVLKGSSGINKLCHEYLLRKSKDKNPKAVLRSVMNRINNERR